MLSPRRKSALIAGAVFIVLGAIAIHASPMSNQALQSRLQNAADDALYQLRADQWAHVQLDGQVATLSGLAPSRQARDAALDAVATASWAGGVVAGGVTRVIDQTRLPGEAEMFALRATLNSGRMHLRGLIPDTETGERLNALAREQLSGRVNTDFRLAPGAAPPGWEEAVGQMITGLGRLDAGAGIVTRDRAALTGLAPSVDDAQHVRQTFQTPPDGFIAAALVRADGETFSSSLSDRLLCELMIEAALGHRSIGFTPGRSNLTGETRAALRRAGEVYMACIGVGDLIVAVRADGPGDEAAALALLRSEAASAAMSEAGVAHTYFLAEAAPEGAPDAIRFTIAPRQDSGERFADQDEEQG